MFIFAIFVYICNIGRLPYFFVRAPEAFFGFLGLPSVLSSGEQDVFTKTLKNSSPAEVVEDTNLNATSKNHGVNFHGTTRVFICHFQGTRFRRVYVVIGWPADFAEVLALLDEKVPPGELQGKCFNLGCGDLGFPHLFVAMIHAILCNNDIM